MAIGKESMVKSLQERVYRPMGVKISNDKVWSILSQSITLCFERALETNVSLSGIGTFKFEISKRSGKRVPKFNPSDVFKREEFSGLSKVNQVGPEQVGSERADVELMNERMVELEELERGEEMEEEESDEGDDLGVGSREYHDVTEQVGEEESLL